MSSKDANRQLDVSPWDPPARRLDGQTTNPDLLDHIGFRAPAVPTMSLQILTVYNINP